MSGKTFHSCCWCVLCSWILHSDFSFLPSWPVVQVLWWSWCHNWSIQAANWDFSTPSFLGRGFLCCLLHVQMHKIPQLWLKLCPPSALVPKPVRVWKPTWSHTNSSFGSLNRYLQRVKKALNIWAALGSSSCEITVAGREEFSTCAHWDYFQWEIASKACAGCVCIFMWMIWIFWIWSYLLSSWKRAVKQGNLKLPEHILPPYCWALEW